MLSFGTHESYYMRPFICSGGILSLCLIFQLCPRWPPGTELAIFSWSLGSYVRRLYTELVIFHFWMYLITDEQIHSEHAHQGSTVSSLAGELPITVLGILRNCLCPSVPPGQLWHQCSSRDPKEFWILPHKVVVNLRQLFSLQGRKPFEVSWRRMNTFPLFS